MNCPSDHVADSEKKNLFNRLLLGSGCLLGIVIVAVAAFSWCLVGRNELADRTVPKLDLTGYEQIRIGASDVGVEKEAMISILENASPVIMKVFHKPDLILMVGGKPGGATRVFSLFLTDGIVYEGDYLDAWTDRMEGRSSVCYRINAEDRPVFAQYLRRP